MDIAAIGSAIATRFAAAAITPPTGYDDIALSTAQLPDAVASLPTVLVFPPEGRWTWSSGGMARIGDLSFPVRFYVGPRQDMARTSAAVSAWYGVLLEQLDAQIALGQTSEGVTHAFITGSRAGSLTYAEQEYLGIEFEVVVHLTRAASFAQ